jgi:hypothetical protein
VGAWARSEPGGDSAPSLAFGESGYDDIDFHNYQRISRIGNTFYGYYSVDGINWNKVKWRLLSVL